MDGWSIAVAVVGFLLPLGIGSKWEGGLSGMLLAKYFFSCTLAGWLANLGRILIYISHAEKVV